MPPKPRLTLRVGVTGHRSDQLGVTDILTIRQTVEAVLRHVKETVLGAHGNLASIYHSDEPVLHVISMLAEGSDRMVAQAALNLGYELQAVLPFMRADYERDFKTDTSREEFQRLLGKANAVLELDGVRSVDDSSHEDGQEYEACGHVILDHCDILIAIWNGDEGKRGGTADIVREADRNGITTIWIDAHAPHEVRFGIRPANGSPSDVFQLLSDRVADLIAPPRSAIMNGPAREYFSERVASWAPTFVWKAFLIIVGRSGLHASPPDAAKGSDERTRILHLNEFDKTQTSNILESAYVCADTLASRYANIYRTTFLLNYLMAASAVLFAFVGYAAETAVSSPSKVKLSLIAGLAEFALIGAILVFKLSGSKRQWHERWIDYRLLAEQLRQQMVLARLGRVLPSSWMARRNLSGSDPTNSWVQWLFEAYARSAGVTGARFTPDYIRDVSGLFADALREQLNYHRECAVRFRKVDHTLHTMGAVLFSTAAIACALHLLNFAALLFHLHLFSHGGRVSLLLALVTVVGPAFGAALMAIRFQGEFERSVRRSRAMEVQLNNIARDLERRETSGDVSSSSLSEIAITGAELMVLDVLDWRTVFLARPLLLPS